MNDLFSNRLAIVTGASAGIGRALAAELVGRGARVLALARSIDRLTELRRELGAQLVPVAVDIGSEESISEFCDWLEGEFEAVDYLVNNAGVGHMDAFLDTEPAQWRDVLDTNLVGALLLVRAVLPGMLEAGRGAIVNVGSSAASGWPYMTLYSASKAALYAATQAIDNEISGRGVRVLSVEIGPTSGTQFAAGFSREEMDRAGRAWARMGLPFDKPISPEASARRIIAAIEEAASS